MDDRTKNDFFKSFSSLKENISSFIKHNEFKDVPSSMKKVLNVAKHDINSLVEKDINYLKNLISKEKEQLEKVYDKVILAELNKAKDFVRNQQKEMERLQKKIEAYVQKNKKTTASKTASATSTTTASTTTKKKTQKKPTVAVVTPKVVTPKKTTQKKATTKRASTKATKK